MQVKICESYDSRWDEFVLAHSAGTFFHQWKWREIISTAFGYEPYYLLAEEKGEVQGVLPLFLVRSLLFGRSLVAIPLAVYGGVVARNTEAGTLLTQKATAIATDRRAKYLELRGNPYLQQDQTTMGSTGIAIKQKDLYVTFMSCDCQRRLLFTVKIDQLMEIKVRQQIAVHHEKCISQIWHQGE